MEEQYHTQPSSDGDFWTHGMDASFLPGVYRQSVQLGVIGALLFLGFEQRPAAFGLITGVAVGLFSLWTVEMTVKLLFRGGRFAGPKLAVGAMAKLPFLLAGLAGIAWAGERGHLSVLAVIGGALLVHGVMLVSVIATAAANQDRNRERYR